MKQFGISGDLTPFEPANPALDIPDGDPLELKKVTDQSMNAFYGELASAITNSGQTLTPVNGTSPNPSQLWQAISSNSFNGNLFVDAGGSTAQVRNLKAANPNTYIPPAIGGDPASTATKAQWVGFCFTMENAQSAAYNTPVTINFKDKNGVTVMTTTLAIAMLFSPFYGQAGSTYIDCIIANDANKQIQPRYSYPEFTKVFESSEQSVEVSNVRPVGQRIQIFKGVINTSTASTTNWNIFDFPVAFTDNPIIVCQRIESRTVAAGQVTAMQRAAFLTVSISDIVGQGFKYIAFSQNGTRSPDLAFNVFAYGYA